MKKYPQKFIYRNTSLFARSLHVDTCTNFWLDVDKHIKTTSSALSNNFPMLLQLFINRKHFGASVTSIKLFKLVIMSDSCKVVQNTQLCIVSPLRTSALVNSVRCRPERKKTFSRSFM